MGAEDADRHAAPYRADPSSKHEYKNKVVAFDFLSLSYHSLYIFHISFFHLSQNVMIYYYIEKQSHTQTNEYQLLSPYHYYYTLLFLCYHCVLFFLDIL